ncbi:MAG: type II toxin-antitoxin system MqsA family antitoxin [Thermodesulfobacteriota bacterium]
MKTRKCPICGIGVLKKKIGTEKFEYKGETISIPDYTTYTCSECGDAIVDNLTLKASGKKLKDFQRRVDGLLAGEQIKAIRIKLGLTQEQLAEIVGGGLKSIARYESGQVCQSKGMDNLLRILDAYPEMLKVIQKKQKSAKVVYMEDVRIKKAYQLREQPFFTGTEEVVYGV